MHALKLALVLTLALAPAARAAIDDPPADAGAEQKTDTSGTPETAAPSGEKATTDDKAAAPAEGTAAPAGDTAKSDTAAGDSAAKGDAGHDASAHSAAGAAGEKHNLDANFPAPKGKMTTLKVGKETSAAYVAQPETPAKGAILVLHEWWGLNDWIKHQADLLAEQGYLALAVDLYKGKVATNPADAQALMGKLDEKWGDKVEEAGTEWLKKQGKKKKVATIGWCMGGGQSLRASIKDAKDVAATVIYYGEPTTDVKQLKKLKGPVLGIWAKKDGWINPEKVKAFEAALTKAGVKHEFHEYDQDHAFANPSNGPKYSSADAKDAWEKTLAFLEKNLAAAPEGGKGEGKKGGKKK